MGKLDVRDRAQLVGIAYDAGLVSPGHGGTGGPTPISLTNTLDEQLELEADLQQEASETRDFHEGRLAFRQKRPPHFEGR
jgi:hypothetical protein